MSCFLISESPWCYIIIFVVLVSYILLYHVKKYLIIRSVHLRLNYSIIFISVTVIIAYVVSLNSTVFSSYAKSPPYYYNFLNPYDAIRFPFEQYDLNNNIIKPNIIPFEKKPNLNNANYFIIVDKTKSTKLPVELTNISNHLKDVLKKSIQSSENSHKPEEEPQTEISLDNLDLRDLVVLNFLRSIYDTRTDSCNFNYQIRLYYGNHNFITAGSSDNRPNTSSVKLSTAFKTYIDSVYSGNSNPKFLLHQNTNFKSIIGELTKKQYIGNTKSNYNNVIIISDFEHEPKNTCVSFDELEEYFKTRDILKNSYNLSLYRLINNEKTNDSAIKTIDIITKNLYNSAVYNYDEESVIGNPLYYDQYLTSLYSSNFVETNLDISLFYPFYDNKRIATANGKCIIFDTSTYHTVCFNNQCLPFYHNISFLKLNKDEVVFCNKPKVICNGKINDTLNMGLFLNTDNLTNNYLDFNIPSELCTYTFRINILEKIPQTSALIMCIFYMIILYSLLYNSTTYIYYAIKSYYKEGNYFHYENEIEYNKCEYNQITELTKIELILLLIFQIYILVWLCCVLFNLLKIGIFMNNPIIATVVSLSYLFYVIINFKYKSRNRHIKFQNKFNETK